MNKIINWTCGGIFRTLGRLLAYVLVGALIGFIIQKNDLKITDLLGIETVNASTIQPTSALYMSLWCEDDTCDYTESGATNHSSWLNVNTSYANPAGHIPGYYLEQLKFRFVLDSSNYLTLGNTYVVSVKFNLNPRIDNGLGLQYWGKVLDLTYSDNTSEQLTGYSATCSIVNNDNYAMVCSFAIQPTKAVKTFTFRINLPFEVGSIWNGIEGVNFKQYAIMTASDTTEAINQQTNELILNSNQNTQEIINQLIEMQEKEKEDNQVCTQYYTNDALFWGYLRQGNLIENQSYRVSDYIKYNEEELIVQSFLDDNYVQWCTYNNSKTLISCYGMNTFVSNYQFDNNVSYFRVTFNNGSNRPIFKLCKNGNQAINDAINDDNVDGAESEANDFFSNFTTNTHGLTGIITAPLNAINSLTSSTCSPLHIPIPFLNNKYLDLPCMRPIYESFFGNFITLWDIITLGIVSYWIMVRIFALVKDFKNPDHDEIEVVDL